MAEWGLDWSVHLVRGTEASYERKTLRVRDLLPDAFTPAALGVDPCAASGTRPPA